MLLLLFYHPIATQKSRNERKVNSEYTHTHMHCIHTIAQCEPEIILYFVGRAYTQRGVRMKQRIKMRSEAPYISCVRIRTTHTIESREEKNASFRLIFHVNHFHFLFSRHMAVAFAFSPTSYFITYFSFLLRILSMTWVLTSMGAKSGGRVCVYVCAKKMCVARQHPAYVLNIYTYTVYIFLCERMWVHVDVWWGCRRQFS